MPDPTRKEIIERLWNRAERHKARRVAAWCQSGKTRKERAKRWEAFELFAHQHAVASRGQVRRWKMWHTIRLWAGGKAKAIRRRLRRHREPDSEWPEDMHVTELFKNDNGLRNHVHVASTDRDKLIQLGRIAVEHYGAAGMVREFPPFDPVECVHTGISWHYRDSSAPYIGRTCANRGDGLAFDLGCAQREAFADEVKRRYGADICDF